MDYRSCTGEPPWAEREPKLQQHDTVRLSARFEFQIDDGSTHVQEFASPGQRWDGSLEEQARIEVEERAKLEETLEALGMDRSDIM